MDNQEIAEIVPLLAYPTVRYLQLMHARSHSLNIERDKQNNKPSTHNWERFFSEFGWPDTHTSK